MSQRRIPFWMTSSSYISAREIYCINLRKKKAFHEKRHITHIFPFVYEKKSIIFVPNNLHFDNICYKKRCCLCNHHHHHHHHATTIIIILPLLMYTHYHHICMSLTSSECVPYAQQHHRWTQINSKVNCLRKMKKNCTCNNEKFYIGNASVKCKLGIFFGYFFPYFLVFPEW